MAKNKPVTNYQKTLETIIENLPVGVFAADETGKIILMNQEAVNVWHGKREVELSSYNIYEAEYFDTGEPVTEWALSKAILKGESTFNEVLKIRCFDGSRKIITNAAIPIYNDKKEKITGGIAVVQDITEKKLLETQIALSEKRFRAIIQNLSDSIVLLDKTGKVKFYSPSVGKLTGFTAEDLVKARSIFDLVLPEDKHIVDENLNKVLTNPEEPVIFEVRAYKKDGGTIWMEITASNSLNDPLVEALIVNYHNIDVRKKAEEIQKQAAQELIDLNESKDKFFSIISHDLRGPFTSLIGLSDFLEKEIYTLSYEEIKHFIGNINQAAGSVFTLLENLLQWSRFKTGRMAFTPEKTDIYSIIEESLNIYISNAKKKNIKIQYELGDDVFVYADKFMIDTVFRNLLSNAVKFTRPQGTIKITVTPGEQVRVDITDNGLGMNDTVKERLFKLGENLSTSGTANEKGTGLGLILCKEYIEKNNGSLFFETTEGTGSTFSFTLPSA